MFVWLGVAGSVEVRMNELEAPAVTRLPLVARMRTGA
jgi:hypothetical protein